ncbi:MAG: DsbA family oxidoreductase [Sphingomonadaceae bacterium]|jgi:predicted DsbA family dithiol-disulfide isomerase|nr:DsbA family oxidoreductase [Sphingomonadaceae bacterium]NBU78217.1 DsbA family oxidoreductase [Sphingomonadaceae bacterium]NCA00911.1 DsbA family oxidoreductase [Sphingomonadaceae bacterium]
MTAPAQLSIDIVSDVVCPWCAIGYKQLERAIGLMGDRVDVGVRWHPFQLAPYLDANGQNIGDYGRERYGASPEQSAANRTRIQSAGAPLGLEFNYSSDSRIYNTRKAHRLLAWAGETGGQTALKLALFQAYFKDQLNISDDDVLLNVVEAAGLDRAAAETALADPRYEEQVDQELHYWDMQNITGVPAFIINGKYMIPGAQDAETFVRVFEKVLEKEAA